VCECVFGVYARGGTDGGGSIGEAAAVAVIARIHTNLGHSSTAG